MSRVLISALCAYWVIHFCRLAAEVSGRPEMALPAMFSASFALTVGCLLVAALFLWSLLAAWGAEPEAGEGAAVPGLAAGAAVLLLAVLPLAAGPVGMSSPAFDATAVQLIALCVSYMIVRGTDVGAPRAAAGRSEQVARRLAVGAAHGSMLARLSKRGPEPSGGEA